MKLKEFTLLIVIFSLFLIGGGLVQAANNSLLVTDILKDNTEKISRQTQRLVLPVAQTSAMTQEYSDMIISDVVNERRAESIKIDTHIPQTDTSQLPGFFYVTIQADPVTKNITGGHWTRKIKQEDSEGNITAQGTLTGRITGVTIVLNENGEATEINGVTLTIVSGTGSYQSVSTGSGTLTGNINDFRTIFPEDENEEPVWAFNGTIQMNF
jgi:hypothetical protein